MKKGRVIKVYTTETIGIHPGGKHKFFFDSSKMELQEPARLKNKLEVNHWSNKYIEVKNHGKLLARRIEAGTLLGTAFLPNEDQ